MRDLLWLLPLLAWGVWMVVHATLYLMWRDMGDREQMQRARTRLLWGIPPLILLAYGAALALRVVERSHSKAQEREGELDQRPPAPLPAPPSLTPIDLPPAHATQEELAHAITEPDDDLKASKPALPVEDDVDAWVRHLDERARRRGR